MGARTFNVKADGCVSFPWFLRPTDGGGVCNMAAPALSSRAGSVGSLGSSPTATPGSSNNNNKSLQACPELDFRSGSRVDELNRLIQEFSKHDQREYDDQRALEIHTAKDFIFSMLGENHRQQVPPYLYLLYYYEVLMWLIGCRAHRGSG